MKNARILAAAAAVALSAGISSAQVNDDFESYLLAPLDGQGQWVGWDGVNTVFANVVNTQNHTSGGSKSVEIAAGADSVHPLSGYTSGKWNVEIWGYVPSGMIGKSYFIVLNTYQAFGPYEWSAQMGFNGNTGRLECDCGGTTSVDRNIAYDTWVDIRCEYDLDADSVSIYYNTAVDPNPIATYPISGGVFGQDAFASLQLEALDLYPDAITFPSVTPIYWDDFKVEQAGPGPVGSFFCPGVGCPCGNDDPGADGGCANTTGQGALLTGAGSTSVAADDIVFTGAGLLPGQPALLFVADNQTNGGAGVLFGDGLRCAGQNVIRRGAKTPNAMGQATWGPGLLSGTGYAPGDTKNWQIWYRDPAGGGVCGNGFNLSNGLSVSYTN